MIALLASLRPRATDWIFSLKTFAAAMTALFIALSCGLEKPFWAMATVYIVSSPMSGALSSKAVYRVLGTIIGATATVVLVPNLVNAPELLSLVLALWVGGCLAVSLLDRTPRSYVTMLGGYTVALIGFPAVSGPGAVFDTAVARVEEIVLGITCAGLFGHLLLPRHVGPMVAGRIDAWLKDAGELTLDAFAGVTGAEARGKRARLAADATELHGLSVHLAYDHSQFRGTTGLMQALRGRMLLLLPLLGGIAARVSSLKQDGALTDDLAQVLERLSAWTRAGEAVDAQEAAWLRARLADLKPDTGPDAAWAALQQAYLIDRLNLFMDVREQCRDLWRAVKSGGAALPPGLDGNRRLPPAGTVHRDPRLAVWSGASAMLSILLFCAFWISSGWADGATGAQMVAVAACLMAGLDDPAVGILSFVRGLLVAIAAVCLYAFVILPGTDGFPLLTFMLALYLVPAGTLMSMPGWGGTGLALCLNFSALIGIQERFSADFAATLNGDMAAVIGMLFAAVVATLVRSMTVQQAIGRLLRANASDLAAIAQSPAQVRADPLAVRMLDRLGLIVPRLAKAGPDAPEAGHALREVIAAINVADLKRARHALPAGPRRAVEELLGRIAGAARTAGEGTLFDLAMTPVAPPLDDALGAVLALPSGGRRDEALTALVALRCALVPGAAAFRPSAVHESVWKEAV